MISTNTQKLNKTQLQIDFTTKLSESNFKVIFFWLLSPLQLLRVYAHTQRNLLLNILILWCFVGHRFVVTIHG